MKEEGKGKVVLPPVNQVGIVVKDLEKTIQFHSLTLGIGPFKIREFKLEGAMLRGKPTNVKMRVALAQAGQVQIELIQVLDGESLHTEFLRDKGEGLHHLGFIVDDIDNKLAQLAKQGIKPVFNVDLPGVSAAYLDSDKIGGVIIELIQLKGKA